MKNIAENIIALGLFMEIISLYGIFKSKKDLVKKLNNNNKAQNDIIQLVIENEAETDFYGFIPDGGILGLGADASHSLKTLIRTSFLSIKNEEVKELIALEKKYKKSKINFCNQFPQLKDEMLTAFKLHQENTTQKKIAFLLNKDSIESLSPQFISFADYTFSITDANYMAYRAFSSKILRKYDLSFDKEQQDEVFGKIVRKQKKLNINDIHFLASMLEKIISSVTNDDLNSSSDIVANEKNKYVATSIIKSNFYRFSKLLDTYNNLVSVEKNTH